MRDAVARHPEVMEKLRAAFEQAGVALNLQPVRGGTDGARLTEMGIPTPNIFTGGYNFHSLTEYAVLEEMEAALAVVKALCAEWATT
jgi:tripeptide aminopeptidase